MIWIDGFGLLEGDAAKVQLLMIMMPVSSFERQSEWKWMRNGWLQFENDENPFFAFNGFSISILIPIIRRDKIGLRRSYCLWLLTHDSAALRWGSRRCSLHRMINDEGGSPWVMVMMIIKRVIYPLTNFLGFAFIGMVTLSMFSHTHL